MSLQVPCNLSTQYTHNSQAVLTYISNNILRMTVNAIILLGGD